MNWVHSLHNETNSEQVRNFLEELTCTLSGGDIPNAIDKHDKVQPVRSKSHQEYDDYDDELNKVKDLLIHYSSEFLVSSC